MLKPVFSPPGFMLIVEYISPVGLLVHSLLSFVTLEVSEPFIIFYAKQYLKCSNGHNGEASEEGSRGAVS
jgi:hypothetical protein